MYSRSNQQWLLNAYVSPTSHVSMANAAALRAAAFDFPTKGILQEAAKNTQYYRLRDSQGKAPGLIGWLPGGYAQ